MMQLCHLGNCLDTSSSRTPGEPEFEPPLHKSNLRQPDPILIVILITNKAPKKYLKKKFPKHDENKC
jgi:hypothetical protein